jgi:hypothetical protein
MDSHQQDTGSQHHELFLQEIEGIDEYWGPTFRYVYIYCTFGRGGSDIKSKPPRVKYRKYAGAPVFDPKFRICARGDSINKTQKLPHKAPQQFKREETRCQSKVGCRSEGG